MLDLRPNCECCDKDLPPSADDAMICTFECTFCRDCVETVLKGVCPNCGGNFFPTSDTSGKVAGKISTVKNAGVETRWMCRRVGRKLPLSRCDSGQNRDGNLSG